MTIKRIILTVLTLFALAYLGLSLLASWTQPQIQSRLELYQTNLVLHGSEWRPERGEGEQLLTLRDNIIGENAVRAALDQYQTTIASTEENLQRVRARELPPPATVQKLEQSLDELKLRSGVIRAELGKTEEAIATWKSLIAQNEGTPTAKTARVLAGLWSEPPRLLPDAEPILRQNLESWFRYQTLARLYSLQERQEALVELNAREQEIAEDAVYKLAIVSAIPGLGLVVGIILLIVLGVQWLLNRKEAILAANADVEWSVPWNGETIAQVFVLGFFLIGQFVVPILFQMIGLKPPAGDARLQAFYVLLTYVLLVLGGVGVLYLSLKPFFPLPEGWFQFKFRDNWILWGLGGYCVALPLVIVVSLLNQQLWDGQGGSNPILPIALENRDGLALAIFFVTASIAAPAFEELMFRGFLLPSLTRYLPLWGAIAASGFFFAVAHLNISEVLPLFVLGMVLGFVYTRSRNLLAPMLLHSLWNSGTLLSLYLLGSAGS
ncbi:MAG: CPBP family intramembrane glutamic endopeptidase [Limnospira sp.]